MANPNTDKLYEMLGSDLYQSGMMAEGEDIRELMKDKSYAKSAYDFMSKKYHTGTEDDFYSALGIWWDSNADGATDTAGQPIPTNKEIAPETEKELPSVPLTNNIDVDVENVADEAQSLLADAPRIDVEAEDEPDVIGTPEDDFVADRTEAPRMSGTEDDSYTGFTQNEGEQLMQNLKDNAVVKRGIEGKSANEVERRVFDNITAGGADIPYNKRANLAVATEAMGDSVDMATKAAGGRIDKTDIHNEVYSIVDRTADALTIAKDDKARETVLANGLRQTNAVTARTMAENYSLHPATTAALLEGVLNGDMPEDEPLDADVAGVFAMVGANSAKDSWDAENKTLAGFSPYSDFDKQKMLEEGADNMQSRVSMYEALHQLGVTDEQIRGILASTGKQGAEAWDKAAMQLMALYYDKSGNIALISQAYELGMVDDKALSANLTPAYVAQLKAARQKNTDYMERLAELTEEGNVDTDEYMALAERKRLLDLRRKCIALASDKESAIAERRSDSPFGRAVSTLSLKKILLQYGEDIKRWIDDTDEEGLLATGAELEARANAGDKEAGKALESVGMLNFYEALNNEEADGFDKFRQGIGDFAPMVADLWFGSKGWAVAKILAKTSRVGKMITATKWATRANEMLKGVKLAGLNIPQLIGNSLGRALFMPTTYKHVSDGGVHAMMTPEGVETTKVEGKGLMSSIGSNATMLATFDVLGTPFRAFAETSAKRLYNMAAGVESMSKFRVDYAARFAELQAQHSGQMKVGEIAKTYASLWGAIPMIGNGAIECAASGDWDGLKQVFSLKNIKDTVILCLGMHLATMMKQGLTKGWRYADGRFTVGEIEAAYDNLSSQERVRLSAGLKGKSDKEQKAFIDAEIDKIKKLNPEQRKEATAALVTVFQKVKIDESQNVTAKELRQMRDAMQRAAESGHSPVDTSDNGIAVGSLGVLKPGTRLFVIDENDEIVDVTLAKDKDGNAMVTRTVGGETRGWKVDETWDGYIFATRERALKHLTSEQPTENSEQGAENNNSQLFGYFDGSLQDLIEKSKSSAIGLIKKIIAPISDRLLSDLSSKGIDLDDGYKHVIDNNAIRHALKSHGGKDEKKRGQIPISEEDFNRIEDVVANYDNIEVEKGKRGNDNIIYSKTYKDGTTIFVEEKRTGRKELAAVTMWKKKTPTLTDANHTEATQISDLSGISTSKVSASPAEKQTGKAESLADSGQRTADNKEMAKKEAELAEIEARLNAPRGKQSARRALKERAERNRLRKRADELRSEIDRLKAEESEEQTSDREQRIEISIGGGAEPTERGAGSEDDSSDKANPLEGVEDKAIDEWFGPVYTEFQGKGADAEEHLREKCEGVAKGALRYPGLSPIDLAWGDKKAWYMKIVAKHPEVVGKLQSILDICKIIEQSDNRVVLESDTHKVIVSKMKGATPTDNWLLTAYEKKKKPVSASSSDIETEPEGKRNGTATPQSELSSDGKDKTLSTDKQTSPAESLNDAEIEAEIADLRTTIEARRKEYAKMEKKPSKAYADIEKTRKARKEKDAALREHANRTAELEQQLNALQQAKLQRDMEAERARIEQAEQQQEDAPFQASVEIRRRWYDAHKEYAPTESSIHVANGKRIEGRWMLVEAGAATASHDPDNNFEPTAGFPHDERGKTVNDRDYQNDRDAQDTVKAMWLEFNERALTYPPIVVSDEGVVLSGNNRWMGGEGAARRGTDSKYSAEMRLDARERGFTDAQIDSFEHPRLVFVPKERPKYDITTFKMYNEESGKTKNPQSEAISLGKTVKDAVFDNILAIARRFETLEGFYRSKEAVTEAINLLISGSDLKETDTIKFYDSQGYLSDNGRSFLENMFIGKAFRGNPEQVTRVAETPTLRTKVIKALAELSANARLSEEYTLSEMLNEAINVVIAARSTGYEAYKEGRKVSNHARVRRFFNDNGEVIKDDGVRDKAVMMLADALNAKSPTLLRSILESYNKRAAEAQRGQVDMFGGDIENRRDILVDILEAIERGYVKVEERRAGYTPSLFGKGKEKPAVTRSLFEGLDDEQMPEGNGVFGPIYNQFKGKAREASRFLKHFKKGQAKAVFHREEIGDIDLVWGDSPNPHNGKGLAHIESKHVELLGDFESLDDAVNVIQDVVLNGEITLNNDGKAEIEKDSYRVVIVKDRQGNWVLTAFDYKTPAKEKKKMKDAAAFGTPGQPDEGAGAVAPNLSHGKGNASPKEKQDGGQESLESEQEARLQQAAQAANDAIDEFGQEFFNAMEEIADLETEISSEKSAPDELQWRLDELYDQAEALQSRLKARLKDYYSACGNSEEDAERMAGDMSQQVKSEVEIRRHQLWRQRNGEEFELGGESAISEDETTVFDGMVRTAGGETIRYNAEGHLPDESRGEFGYVERQFAINGRFSFTGGERIESREDVAYLFRSLESYAAEHVFAVFVKDGKAIVMHIGMGGPAASFADLSVLRAGYDITKADKVYLVHNHPSGSLRESAADRQLLRNAKDTLKGEAEVDGIIIDTTSGRYAVFRPEGKVTDAARPTEGGNKSYETFEFDRADFSKKPKEGTVTIRTPQDVASVVSTLRLGNRGKVSFLVLSHSHEVIGNFHTTHTDLSDTESLSREMASVATKFGGSAVVLYGNMDLTGSREIKAELRRRTGGVNTGIVLLDALSVRQDSGYRSAMDTGILGEPRSEYGHKKSQSKTRQDLTTPPANAEVTSSSSKGKAKLSRESKEMQELHSLNELFNEQLDKLVSGELKSGELNLGQPGLILRSIGISGTKITLDCDVLRKKMSESYKHEHPFDYKDLRNLPISLNNPVAVFESKGHGDFNILVELIKDGKNFVVSLKARNKATRVGELVVEEIVTLYPKEEKGVVNWINSGLGKFFNKKKALEWLTRREPHAHKYTIQELEDATKIINNFENPTVNDDRVVVIPKVAGFEVEVDEQMESRGEFDTATGKVRVNPRLHDSAEDMAVTAAHEIVGHAGMQALVGRNRLTWLGNEVWRLMNAEMRNEERGKRNGVSESVAGLEHIASLVEKKVRLNGDGKFEMTDGDPGILRQAVGYVRVWLAKLGLVHLSDADIEYMIYRSVKGANNGSTMRRLQLQMLDNDPMANLMQVRLQRPAVSWGDGAHVSDYALMSKEDADRKLESLATVTGRMTFGQRAVRNFWNINAPLNRWAKRMLGDVDDNTYRRIIGGETLGEFNERMASMLDNRMLNAQRNLFEPMAKTANSICEGIRKEHGVDADMAKTVWDTYLLAKTGLERQSKREVSLNGQLAEAQRAYDDARQLSHDAYVAKGVSDALAWILAARDNKVLQGNISSIKNAISRGDYAGLKGTATYMAQWLAGKDWAGVRLNEIDWDAEAGALGKTFESLTPQEVNDILESKGYPTIGEWVDYFETRHDTGRYWDLAREVSNDILDTQVKSGLLAPESWQRLRYGATFFEIVERSTGTAPDESIRQSKDIADVESYGVDTSTLERYYEYYLPMKGKRTVVHQSAEGGKMTGGTKGVGSTSGKIKGVRGHSEMTDDPLKQLAADFFNTHKACLDNDFKAKVAEVARKTTRGNEVLITYYNLADVTSTKGMAMAEEADAEARRRWKDRGTITFMENGVPMALIASDVNAMDSVNRNIDGPGPGARAISRFNRWFASNYTNWSLSFVATNAMRDLQTQIENTAIRGKKNVGFTVADNKMMKALYRGLQGKPLGATDEERYVSEYLSNGGKTASHQLGSRADVEHAYKELMDSVSGKSAVRKGAEKAVEAITRLNEMVENRARVLTYVEARRRGKTIAEAIHLAKESTVNFDRHGAMSGYMAAIQIFMNAAFQGSRRQYELYKESPARFLAYHMASSTLTRCAGFFLGWQLYNMFSDDDKIDNLRDYAKRYFAQSSFLRSSNALLPISDKVTGSMPLAMDERPWNRIADIMLKGAILGYGDTPEDARRLNEDMWDAGKAVVDVFGVEPLNIFGDILDPNTNMTFIDLIRTNPAGQIIATVGTGRDYTDRPIHGNDTFHKELPNYHRDYGKDSWSHKWAMFLNDVSGGSEDTPGYINLHGADIDATASGLGGFFSTMFSLTGWATSQFLDEDPEAQAKPQTAVDKLRHFPILPRFTRQSLNTAMERDARNRMYDASNAASAEIARFKRAMAAGNAERMVEIASDENFQHHVYAWGRSNDLKNLKQNTEPWAQEYAKRLTEESYYEEVGETNGLASYLSGLASIYNSLPMKGNLSDDFRMLMGEIGKWAKVRSRILKGGESVYTLDEVEEYMVEACNDYGPVGSLANEIEEYYNNKDNGE